MNGFSKLTLASFFLVSVTSVYAGTAPSTPPAIQYYSDQATGDQLYAAQGNMQQGSYEAAIAAYQALANQNQKLAEYQLGFCFLNGLGTDKDNDVAVAWYM